MISTPTTCKQDPGAFVPAIDRNRCEGEGPCVPACPYGVLALGQLSPAERATLSWKGRVKAFMHGGSQAFLVAAERCRACGECVRACPEHAITLACASA
jgi:NAD-dependent dihydropyrimidine dehydrogenase PreA subunit